MEVLPCVWAVRPVNRDKGVVQMKVTGQSKHTVSGFRELGWRAIEPELLLSPSLFCCLQLFCELSLAASSFLTGALLLSKSNLIAFNGNNCASEVLICITGADGCFLCRPRLVIVLFGFPPPFLSEWTVALHCVLSVVNGLKVTLSLITVSV